MQIPKPKRKRHPKGCSISNLESLWRQAVRAVWFSRCAFSSSDCNGTLEAHHVIRRSKGVLSHDWRNGMLLCKAHHAWADTAGGRFAVHALLSQQRRDYLAENDILKPDWLKAHGMTDAEFRQMRHDELTKLIFNSKHGELKYGNR